MGKGLKDVDKTIIRFFGENMDILWQEETKDKEKIKKVFEIFSK